MSELSTDALHMTAPLRVGRRVGRTIYAQLGPEPSDDDPLVATADSPVLAERIVRAVNAAPVVAEPTDADPVYEASGGIAGRRYDRELSPATLRRWQSCSRNEAIAQAEGSHAEVQRLNDAIDSLHAQLREAKAVPTPPAGAAPDREALMECGRGVAAVEDEDDAPATFDRQAAEEGYEPCARGQQCELQLVRPGKVQCDCDSPGTDAALARAEAEAVGDRTDRDALLRAFLKAEVVFSDRDNCWIETDVREAERMADVALAALRAPAGTGEGDDEVSADETANLRWESLIDGKIGELAEAAGMTRDNLDWESVLGCVSHILDALRAKAGAKANDLVAPAVVLRVGVKGAEKALDRSDYTSPDGRRWVTVEADPESGEPLTTEHYRHLASVAESAVAVPLRPDVVGTDAKWHEAVSGSSAIAAWVSGADGAVWVTEDGEIAAHSRYSGHYVSEWHGQAITAAHRWREDEMPVARGEIVSGKRAEHAPHGTTLVRVDQTGRALAGSSVIETNGGFNGSANGRYRVLDVPGGDTA